MVAGEETDPAHGRMKQGFRALGVPLDVCVARRRQQQMVRNVPTLMDVEHARRFNG
jgi:hypothetical protein